MFHCCANNDVFCLFLTFLVLDKSPHPVHFCTYRSRNRLRAVNIQTHTKSAQKMKKTVIMAGLLLTTWLLNATSPEIQQGCLQAHYRLQILSHLTADSLPTAKVVLYRPHDQLKRKYAVQATGQSAFSLARKEEKVFDTNAGKVTFSVDALGHRSGNFTFVLSTQKTHYFRVQDRNNYAGFQPFLEVIEVTEQTYRDDVGNFR
jgi:hypothetical protein